MLTAPSLALADARKAAEKPGPAGIVRTLPRNFGDDTYPVTIPPTPGMDKRVVKLKSRYFIPDKEKPIHLHGDTGRIYVQFNRTLTNRDLRKLESIGATVEDYVTNNTFVVHVTRDALAALRRLPFVQGLQQIDWRDKVSEALYRGWVSQEAMLPDGFVRLNVALGAKAAIDRVSWDLERAGARFLARLDSQRHIVVAVPEWAVPDLAILPKIRYVEQSTPPVPLSVLSGVMSNVYWYTGEEPDWELHGLFDLSPYLLDGYVETNEEPLTGGIRDVGPVLSEHGALTGQILYNEEGETASDHATRVAGIIAGNSGQAEFRGEYYDFAGQAYGSELVCYHSVQEDPATWSLVTDFNHAFQLGVCVMNMSYGIFAEDGSDLGHYTSWSRELDEWMRSHAVVQVAAAAGNEFVHYSWESVSPPATAKNPITVGAVAWTNAWDDPYGDWDPDDPEDAQHTHIAAFSSCGPCTDLRIKPDLVARGEEVLAPSAPGTSDYTRENGTSFSAPVVAGASLLIVEALVKEYEPYPGAPIVYPGCDVVKAILCNTARDQISGPNWHGMWEDRPGPDYRYGFGLLDAEAAAKTVYRDLLPQGYQPPGGHILTGVIEETKDQVEFTVDLRDFALLEQPLRVTLAWTDKEGALEADPALVNDLDLEVIAPNPLPGGPGVFYPFSLNPEVWGDPAWSDRPNHVDNIEQIVVDPGDEELFPEGVLPSGDWIFRINGYLIAERTQKFALVSSGGFNAVTFLNCNIWDGEHWRNTEWPLTRDPDPTLRVPVSAPIAGIWLTGDDRPFYAYSTDGTDIDPQTAQWHSISGAYSDPDCSTEITSDTYRGTIYLKIEGVPFNQLSRSDNRLMVRVRDASQQYPQSDHDSPSFVVPTPSDCYVSLDGSDQNGYGSRDYPYRTISYAILNLSGVPNGDNPVQVRVGQGTYEESISLIPHVQLYGGFDDNWERNNQAETTIEGPGGTTPTVTGANGALLDGFTVKNGNPAVRCHAVSPTISDCILEGTLTGAALSCRAAAAPIILSCTIKGGDRGVECSGSGTTPDLINCDIMDNKTGMKCSAAAEPMVVNTFIHHNDVDDDSLASALLCAGDAHVHLLNCTIVHNENSDGGCSGVMSDYDPKSDQYGTVTIVNSILWSNDGDDLVVETGAQGTVSYSCVESVNAPQGWNQGGNLLATDPLLVGEHDLHLSRLSPCIDLGNNNAQDLPDTDFEGDPRIAVGATGATVDMGADEYNWTGTIVITGVPSGVELSWDCIRGATEYKVYYADELSMGMTWTAFPGTVDGSGLERASYTDTSAGSAGIRFYRIRKWN